MTNKEMIQGLKDISELLGSKLFQLDNETESELLELGVIKTDTNTMENSIDKAIELLK